MTTHYGIGLVDDQDLHKGEYFSESTDFDVEKDKSSDVKIITDGYHDGNLIMKNKKRKFDNAVYESFMLDLWNNILDIYSEENEMELIAPESKDLIYDFEDSNSTLIMDYCPGKPLKKVSNGKSNKSNFLNYDVNKPEIASYYVGVLDKIKESEELLHTDYDGRHVLFYDNQVNGRRSLSVIDVENSRFADDPEKVRQESRDMREILDKHFPNVREEFYDMGYNSVDGLYCREDVLEETQVEYNEKFKKDGKSEVKVDPFDGKVLH